MKSELPQGTRRPILVTGVPRSGTTWLARLLARAPGTAMAGREPMNAHNRQYGLGGTLPGWARLTDPTPGQRRRLALAYRGLNPFVFSRYGSGQWRAPLPGTRVVVKDPYALASIPTVAEVTGAVPVLLFRHPGAVLASYRRMGWSPGLAPLCAMLEEQGLTEIVERSGVRADLEPSSAEALGRFWTALHELALDDIASAGTPVVVVSHRELAIGGADAGRALAGRLGLTWSDEMTADLERESSGPVDPNQLHNFDRNPAEVADAWRAKLPEEDVAEVEAIAAGTLARLEELRGAGA
ncbi:sulfotransferase [Nocardioides sp. YIM 152588]|uniref:sulfotransferase n=1 Tax=Nocardioides sp. YIM 152588 TaxID=3158259 RepID=UPI0032E40C31